MTTPLPPVPQRPLSATHLSYATSHVSLCTPLLAALVLLAACHPHQQKALPPVPVTAGARDLRLLVGEWQGGYVSRDSTRRGKIAFRLRAGKDTAEGLVTVDGPKPPAGCVDPLSLATSPRVAGKLALTLGIVTVGEPSVGGWLRRYQDPELGCLVDTWFEGTIDRDTIRGMYFTNPTDTAKDLRLGNWWVSRQR